jgi:hypothetical protein
MYRGDRFLTLTASIACLCILQGLAPSLHSAPYASGVSIQGTTVNFTLNEPADTLAISINGGAFTFLDGSAKGLKTFNLGSASDTFSISVFKNDPVGYTIPTGNLIGATTNGLSQATAEGGFRLLSNDADNFVKYNSPRGVTVAVNPNNPQFGISYISNSTAGTTAGRSVGDGLYAIKADQSDAFGYGNTAKVTGFETGTNSTNSPFRLSIGADHNVYIADFSDAYGGVYRMSGALTGPTQMLDGVGGPSTLPAGQNHGSTTAVYASGSASGLTLYTVDEDLTSSQFGGGSTSDKNSIWKYEIGASALPYAGTPTRVAGGLEALATSDLDIGSNGNFYLAQNRLAGTQVGVLVFGPDGTPLFNSLTESRSLLGDPSAPDILRNILGISISPDQKYLAAILFNSDVVVVPLDSNGIPIIANRMVINTGTDITSGRDIAFDAADNIHYVSSGQALYRVLSPGGITAATTSWNGSSYSFVLVPEPSTACLLGFAAIALAGRRRRPFAA